MKVPYAKKWQKETDKLRKIALDCDLIEELKWGKPCLTFMPRALRALSDSHSGVVAQVERANRKVEHSIESRAKTLDALLREWKADLVRSWIPMIAGASLL